ncbi:ABC transporter ATP-binding protein [Ramlibacter tataouinensis]|uniref:Candidate ABC transporter, ATP-binding component probably involved in an Fe3+ transport system n=1 Tax=Ramlibacter tataouinensis (strain ATCC BAA-407 / DSM 14655 / LMG 21543 / TTB310) TaxID=365046 RepID=F5Y5I3_RAMTT|nr:ABC transporter ATP-binding protein [Ramlibacter tataouinensis]AEG92679.1 candidate ABC transporter, ATP-binding component probably involved in an Fe3+ transport system [Ramlibacter tataouinensis TTB310]
MGFLELKGLTKRYGSAAVVKDVSLSVEKGQLVCLLGPSGCGKTTTLRLIAGFLQPDGGEIRVGGRRVSSPGDSEAPERRNMSMIFQSYALWPHMTVMENVTYGLKLRGLSKDDTARRAETILAATKLAQLAQRYPGELSGGQQQRVSLARALVVEPETLLLDEPLSNLDANLREEMRFEIRRLHDKYRYTTVYVTHDQAEAMTAADLIVVMNQGVIEQAGSPEDIYQRPRTEFVARFIGGTNILRGRWDGRNGVAGGNQLLLRCGSGEFAEDGDTAVSVRHHDVRLSASRPAGETNVVQGRVTRQIYLGSHRDYLVALPGGETLRAVTPSHVSIPPGDSVWLHLPPEHCRALAH